MTFLSRVSRIECCKVALFLGVSFSIFSCSTPSLESQACTYARPSVREFYSFHFGNDLLLSNETLKRRERFLSKSLYSFLIDKPEGVDPFTTGTRDVPRAFRVGECTEIEPGKVNFQILLFWRDETTAAQKTINVDLISENDRWLVDKVTF